MHKGYIRTVTVRTLQLCVDIFSRQGVPSSKIAMSGTVICCLPRASLWPTSAAVWVSGGRGRGRARVWQWTRSSSRRDTRPQLHTALHTTHLPCPGPSVESRPSHTGVWWHLGQAAIISPIIYNTDTVIVKYINIISTLYHIDIYISTYMIRVTKAWDIYL